MSGDVSEEERAPPGWIQAIERGQGWLFVPLLAGLVLWPVAGTHIGVPVMGASIALAGLVPILSGRYVSGPFRLRGTAARLRGLVSVGIGVAVVLFGLQFAP